MLKGLTGFLMYLQDTNQESKSDEAPPPVADSAPSAPVEEITGDPETDKKIRNLKKVPFGIIRAFLLYFACVEY